jgi:rubrerythrin
MLGFARTNKAPDWPVKVTSEAGASRLKVAFLGTPRVGILSRSNFFPFTIIHLKKLSTATNLRRGAFKAAIQELKSALEAEKGKAATRDTHEELKKDDTHEEIKKDDTHEETKKDDGRKKNETKKKGLRAEKALNEKMFTQTMKPSLAKTSWTCQRCNMTTGFRFKARMHAVTCNSVVHRRAARAKRLPCWLCPSLEAFPTARLLQRHAKERHGRGNRFICVNHPKPVSFSTRRIYFRHLAESHSTHLKKQCSYCKTERLFTRTGNYHRQM